MVKHHIIIAGTGRAGTTFLVQYLTACGLETHLSRNPGEPLDAHANAGLEDVVAAGSDLPCVIKSPWLFEFIDRILDLVGFRIDAVVIPMRDIIEAASSRVTTEMHDRLEFSKFNEEMTRWESWGKTPGGVLYSLNPVDQARILAMGFHHVIHACVRRDIPIVFLDFPRLIDDPEYLYRQLEPVIGQRVGHDAAVEAHRRVAKPELVRAGNELMKKYQTEFPAYAELDRAALFREIKRLRRLTYPAQLAMAFLQNVIVWPQLLVRQMLRKFTK